MGIRVPVRLKTIENAIAIAHGGARSLSVDEIDILDEVAWAITTEIEEAWPVDTSTSRDAFHFTIQSAPGNIGFTILNEVDYVQFIHRAGTPVPATPGRGLWSTLIPEIIAPRLAGILMRLRIAVADTERAIDAQAGKPKGHRLSQAQVLSRSWRGRKAA